MINLSETLRRMAYARRNTPRIVANASQLEATLIREAEYLEEAAELLQAQEPLTAEVKWQKRHRKSYRQYTGFDAMGDEHTVTVCEESEGREPYCGKCSAQLAESFINYCPRCGVKLITLSNPTAEQREATAWMT